MSLAKVSSVVVLPALWAVGTIVVLISTLVSLRRDSFDGLNNIWQIPFALPWFMLPVSVAGHTVDAWIVAGEGLLNAGLLALWLRRRRAV